MAEKSIRFVSLDKPIDEFIEDQKNKNTLSKTRRDISLLTEFLNSKNESRSFVITLENQLRQRLHERGFTCNRIVFDAVTPSVYTTPIETVAEIGSI